MSSGLMSAFNGVIAGNQQALVAQKQQQQFQQVFNERYNHIMGHEQAHAAAAGAYGGGIVIEYGPDGLPIAGHVPISIPGLNPEDPEGSYAAYQQIYDAALAPGDPSGADRGVAAQAVQLMGQAKTMMGEQAGGQTSGQGLNVIA